MFSSNRGLSHSQSVFDLSGVNGEEPSRDSFGNLNSFNSQNENSHDGNAGHSSFRQSVRSSQNFGRSSQASQWTRTPGRLQPTYMNQDSEDAGWESPVPEQHIDFGPVSARGAAARTRSSFLPSAGGSRSSTPSAQGYPSTRSREGPSPSAAGHFGSTFGTPKPAHLTKLSALGNGDDAPPQVSIYDAGTPASRSLRESLREARGDDSNGGAQRRSSMAIGTAEEEQKKRVESQEEEINALVLSNAVVIFGFPASMDRLVMNHFARFGTILEPVGDAAQSPVRNRKDLPPAPPVLTGRNWMRITYADTHSAVRAVEENGVLFGGFAIGCAPFSRYPAGQLKSAGEQAMFDDIHNGGYNSLMEPDANPVVRRLQDLHDPNSPDARRTAARARMLRGPEMADENSGQSGSTLNRASSTSNMADSKYRISVQDGVIYNTKPKESRLFGFLGGGSAKAPELENPRPEQPPKGWLGVASKRASEFVFGWDDL